MQDPAASTKPIAAPGRLETWGLVALLCVHIALGIYWSMSIPIWEAHDEDGHYYFVRFLATERRLPAPGERSISPNDEMHQPPLYYALAALPVSLVKVEQELSLQTNPYFTWAYAQGGHNRFIHDRAAESWPYQGTALAVHLARLVSVLLGALGLLFTFWAARLLVPDEPWVRWGAVLALAFWPQYRFTTAVINNDILVTVCVSAVTWLLVRLIMMRQVHMWDLAGLGVALGLAPLAKGNGLVLLPVTLVVLLACAIVSGPALRKRLLVGLGAALALGGLVVGWWYLHNVSSGMGMLGGDRSVGWVRDIVMSFLTGRQHILWFLLLPALEHGAFSMWAGFGWNNLGLPIPYYWTAALWVGLGLAGLALWLLRRRPRRQVLGMGVVLLVGLATVIPPLLQVLLNGMMSLQGRTLLTALPSVCVALAVGWTALLPRRVRTAGWALLGGALGLLAVVTPWLYIAPAYAPPRQVSEAQLAGYAPVHVSFGDFAELVGYRIDGRFLNPGDTLRVELAWRVLAQTPADHTLAVQAFQGERSLIGEAHRFPGRGALTTSTWQVGSLFVEDVAIPVQSAETDGHLAWLEVSLYRTEDLAPVTVKDQAGNSLGSSLRIGELKMRGTAPTRVDVPAASLRFGPSVRLIGGQAEMDTAGSARQLVLTLEWATEGQLAVDYTASVQLRSGQQPPAAQVDRQPQGGNYPTSIWEARELVTDQYVLSLPAGLAPGTYTLYACLYDLGTLQRLPAAEPDGPPLENSEAPLLTVVVADGQEPRVVSQWPLLQIGTAAPDAGS